MAVRLYEGDSEASSTGTSTSLDDDEVLAGKRELLDAVRCDRVRVLDSDRELAREEELRLEREHDARLERLVEAGREDRPLVDLESERVTDEARAAHEALGVLPGGELDGTLVEPARRDPGFASAATACRIRSASR